jgi:hypothetical protein
MAAVTEDTLDQMAGAIVEAAQPERIIIIARALREGRTLYERD